MRFRHQLLAAGATWVMLAGHAAQAQTPQAQGTAASAPAQQADTADIIVTANKRSQSLNKVGLAITAIGAESLERKKVASLSDLAQNVPGLTFTNSTNSTPVYTLRGIGFYETSLSAYPTVSVYLDEAPLPFPVMTTLTNFDLERVEVLKGPQGTLFGNNATGGAINYIAAKPQDTFGVGGSVSYARFNDVRVDGYVTGALAPNLKGRLAVATEQSDGWQYSISRPGDRNGATHTVAARGLLDWDASSNLRVQLDVNGWSDRSQPVAGQFSAYREQFPGSINGPMLAALVPAPNNPRAADWTTQFRPSSANWLLQGVLRMDLKVSDDVTITSLTNYAHYKHHQVVDGDGLPLSVVDFIFNNGKIDSFSQELRISNGSNGSFRWLGGLNYANDRVYENNMIDYKDTTAYDTFGGVSVSGYYSRQHMQNYAAFGNVEFDVVPTLTLKVGARYTQANRDSEVCAYDPFIIYDPSVNGSTGQFARFIDSVTGASSSNPNNPPLKPFECYQINSNFLSDRTPLLGKLNQGSFSYRAGIDWKPLQNVLLYVNVAKGYKAGSYPALAGTFDPSFNPVTQESVLSYEGGVKAQLLDRRLTIDAAVFHYDYRDKQLRSKLIDPVIGILDALVNIPKSHVTGFEFSGSVRPVQGLSLSGSVTYLDAKIDQFIGVNAAGSNQDFNGALVPYTPKWQYNLGLDYLTPVSSSLNAFAGVQFNHRSGTNAVIGAPTLFALPSYGLLDLQLGVEAANQKWRAFIWGKNVGNEFYLTQVQQSYDSVSRYAGRPATYGVTVSFKY